MYERNTTVGKTGYKCKILGTPNSWLAKLWLVHKGFLHLFPNFKIS
jgi:hypothetical protein